MNLFVKFPNPKTHMVFLNCGSALVFAVAFQALEHQNAFAGADTAEEVPYTYKSAYHLGMGNAGLAISKGTDATFVNPAGLANSNRMLGEFSLLSPHVELSSSAAKQLKNLSKVNVQNMLGEAFVNKPFHAYAQNYFGLILKRSSIAITQSASGDVYLGRDYKTGVPSASFKHSSLGQIALGSAQGLATDNVLLGSTAKYMWKKSCEKKLVGFELTNGKKVKEVLFQDCTQGAGVGFDLGLTFRASKTNLKPSIGIVAQNVSQSYSWSVPKGKTAPRNEPLFLNTGVALSPTSSNAKVNLAADYKDILGKTKQNTYKRIHLGAVAEFKETVGAMVGLNQGYFTFGGFVSLKVIKLEAGSYTEELGGLPGGNPDRRYFGKMTLGWIP